MGEGRGVYIWRGGEEELRPVLKERHFGPYIVGSNRDVFPQEKKTLNVLCKNPVDMGMHILGREVVVFQRALEQRVENVSVDHRFADITRGPHPLLKNRLSHARDGIRNSCSRDEKVGVHDNVVLQVVDHADTLVVKAPYDVDERLGIHECFAPRVTKLYFSVLIRSDTPHQDNLDVWSAS